LRLVIIAPDFSMVDVTEALIEEQLALTHEDAGGAADLMRDEQRLVRPARPALALVHN
jgi:hypothetical protein